MTREEVTALRDLAAAADDLDTGSLDAFRAAATPAVVYELAIAWLREKETHDNWAALFPGAAGLQEKRKR